MSRSIEESIRNPTGEDEDWARMFGRLRSSAQQMDRNEEAIEAAAKKVAATGGDFYSPLRLSVPAAQNAEASINSLTDLATADLPQKLRAMEARARDLITDDLNRLRHDAEVARDDVRARAVQYREAYREELRHGAQRYFGQERDLDDVLADLVDRHASGAAASRSEAVACGADR